MPKVKYIDGDTELCDKITFESKEYRDDLVHLIENGEIMRTSETSTIMEIV